MPKYRFVTGRYDSSGKRINKKVEKTTKGKLSTLSGIRTGQSSKKTEQYTYVKGSEDRSRKVLTYKGSVRTFAQLKLGQMAKNGKFNIIPSYGSYSLAFKDNVIEMAEAFRAPPYMINKLKRMDADTLYYWAEKEGHTFDVYFDYGADKMENVEDVDLFYNEKWDDIQFLIDQYERTFGIIG